MSEGILARIQQAVREKRYQMTDHALEEADADDLSLDDILDVGLDPFWWRVDKRHFRINGRFRIPPGCGSPATNVSAADCKTLQ